MNCDFNHTFEHGNATGTQKCRLTCSKIGIARPLFHANCVDAFPFQTGLGTLIGSVANGDFNHNFEHGNATSA